jgi:prephenate dehydrogenase
MKRPRQSLGTVSIIGVGLIGGSLASALKGSGRVDTIIGCGRSAANLDHALDLGLLDHWTHDPEEAASAGDIVMLATPISAVIGLMPLMERALRPSAVLTDASSVKMSVNRAARSSLESKFSRFVPGHPVTGSEKSGAGAAKADLFQNHWVILSPLAETDEDAVDLVTDMWAAAGARTRLMSESLHDQVLGMISHLPHVVAYALMSLLDTQAARDDCLTLAAGGFFDISRIASSDPVMWRDILLHNGPVVRELIAKYRDTLGELDRLIELADGPRLESWFANARELRSAIQELRPPAKRDSE